MDVTMIGLQNAGKTSLLRVLSVSENSCLVLACPSEIVLLIGVCNAQGGEFAIE